jgi:hypothetical protein
MHPLSFRHKTLILALTLAASGANATAFNRIASFETSANLPAEQQANETSAEIIAASEDGNTLVYSDSPNKGLGFIDISNPKAPQPAGYLALKGEPTSVAVASNYILAAVNTSASYTQPSGLLATISLANRTVLSSCDLGGQPDSVAVSKDGKYAAIAIENERDEELNEGALPQLPAGFLAIVNLDEGKVVCDSLRRIDLTGLSDISPEDPEPEFVDFNANNEIALTLQENNHLVIISAQSGQVLNHFSAGAVDLTNIDTSKDGKLVFSDSQEHRLREPDTVKWLDNDRFVIANEGDYKGGARGFSIFHKDGRLLYEAGNTFEHEIVRIGHYPEKRSGKKGNEPEGLAIGTYGDQTYIFVLSERASIAGVYRDTGAAPELLQMLPSGIAPESAVTIPSRNLMVTANEKDFVEDGGARSHVMIYELSEHKSQYPQIHSTNDKNGLPLGWGALSGLTSDDQKPGILYAVNDSFYSQQPSIFTIDANQKPASITSSLAVTLNGEAADKLDLEGITSDRKGGFWLASEGNAKKEIPHALYHVNNQGKITQTVAFPASLLAHETRFGAEGITLIGDTLWVAIQRPWGDDPENKVKLLAFNLTSQSWGAVHYPLEETTQGWVGLSEITSYKDSVYIIERDNQIGSNAAIKRLYKVSAEQLKPVKLGEKLPVVHKELVRDFIPDLKSLHGYIQDKIEGFAIDANGQGFAMTDNDGVDDSSGETLFFSTGKM